MARSQQNGITKLLRLRNCQIGKVTSNEEKAVVEVEIKGEGRCPFCGSTRLYRHGICEPRQVLHTWINGTRVYLELRRQRFRCLDCRHTFTPGKELVRPRSRLTRQAETEALWQLRHMSFSQVKREMGIGYSALRRLLDRQMGEETLGFIGDEAEIYLGIDEHSFTHQEMVYTITEVKHRRVLGILRDDRIATLKKFLGRIPRDKVKEVCIDMRDGLRKATEAVFPWAKVVVDPFHVIADANRRMDEARRIEQDVHRKRKVKIPKRIFLVGRERLSNEKREEVDRLLEKYPELKGFYWAKERIRELYHKSSRMEATVLLDNVILNLRMADDAELIRWGNTLKYWKEPILNHFDNHTTNGFTEGCHTKIKMLKRISYGLNNVEVYWKKMLLGFVPSRTCFHTI